MKAYAILLEILFAYDVVLYICDVQCMNKPVFLSSTFSVGGRDRRYVVIIS